MLCAIKLLTLLTYFDTTASFTTMLQASHTWQLLTSGKQILITANWLLVSQSNLMAESHKIKTSYKHAINGFYSNVSHTHTHPFNGPLSGLPGWADTRKVKPIWILPKQETVSGSSISWAICNSAPRSKQITTPAPRHSVFYRPDALPAAQPTASKHWRNIMVRKLWYRYSCHASHKSSKEPLNHLSATHMPTLKLSQKQLHISTDIHDFPVLFLQIT